jgi:RNA polymerase sigma-70 factor (ECF subfamily)
VALRFEEFMERHHDEISAYLWRLLNRQRDGSMDVDDLVQEVFMRAYRGFARLHSSSNHRAWLYKIATNCAYTRLQQLRKRRDGLSSLRDSMTNGASAGDGSDDGKTQEQRVRGFVNGLPEKQRACVTLRYFQDLDYPEIAQILNCSQASARANIYQAMRRLRALLREES